MKKENILILIALTTSFFVGSRLVFKKIVTANSKRESVSSLQVQTQQGLGTSRTLANTSNIRPKLNKIENNNVFQKIEVKQNNARANTQSSVINESSNLKTADRIQDAKKQEIANYVSEVRHRLAKQDEFLKLKVGLNNEQIEMVHTKNIMYQKQIEFAKVLAVKKSANANRIKMMILAEHSDWMTYVLGPENFAEYMRMAPKSYSTGANEI